MKVKLSAKQKRDGVDLRDVMSDAGLRTSRSRHRSKAARKSAVEKAARATVNAPKKPKPPAEFRPIDHVGTTLHDPIRDRWASSGAEGGVRLYCTAITHGEDNGRWALQVRAWVKLGNGRTGKHFAVGTASMSSADLRWLRDLVDAALRGEV